LSRFPTPRSFSQSNTFVRVNGKIRAREVRVIGNDGAQLGVISLNEALAMARAQGVDLVEIAANATPPVCRIVDYGKYRYELAKKDKESKKHQHANKVKEIQLSPTIDPHDFSVKLTRAIDFMCDDMKVKITLKFRGREMAHQEYGFQTVNKFIKELIPFGTPDSPPKLLGRGINVMLTPLPRAKRAKNPNVNAVTTQDLDSDDEPEEEEDHDEDQTPQVQPQKKPETQKPTSQNANPAQQRTGEFANNPFNKLDVKLPE
jgi:translation initiation factor IF-3